MKPFRIKHIPTGLYYHPHSVNGNLTIKGKLYQKENTLLLRRIKFAIKKGTLHTESFIIECLNGSKIHSLTKDNIKWVESLDKYLKYETLLTDWEIEYLNGI